MHYHHAWNGFYSGTWDHAKTKYSKIMSDQENVNYVTVLRDPVAHYLSYYYYFLNPINKVGVACVGVAWVRVLCGCVGVRVWVCGLVDVMGSFLFEWAVHVHGLVVLDIYLAAILLRFPPLAKELGLAVCAYEQ